MLIKNSYVGYLRGVLLASMVTTTGVNASETSGDDDEKFAPLRFESTELAVSTRSGVSAAHTNVQNSPVAGLLAENEMFGGASFSAINANYDITLWDITGIIHDGITPHEDAVKTANMLIADPRKTIIFLSNTPRPGDGIYKKLIKMGIDTRAQVFTSGDATQLLLQSDEYKGKLIYNLGSERNTEIIEGLKLDMVTSIDECNVVLLTAYLEPWEDMNEKYSSDLDYIINNSLPVICANPDVYAMNGRDIRKCSGYIAKELEDSGVEVLRVGKPSAEIYNQVFKKYNLTDKDKKRTLMIGDTLETDVVGATAFAIDSLLVLTGNTARDCQKADMSISRFLRNSAIKPTYYSDSLG